MKLVTVQKVIYAGKHGGGVFRGISEDLIEYRFIGNAMVLPRPPIDGEVWLVNGFIRKHPTHGKQVEIEWAKLEKPSGRLIIHAIAKSRLFPGIGINRAKHLWERHGDRLYGLLDAGNTNPFVDILGPDLSEVLIDGWKQLARTSEVFAWLDENGIPIKLANDLMTVYPSDLIQQIEENPYRILAFTNWEKANTLARSLGFLEDCELRFFAAADALNYKRIVNNHTWTTRNEFIEGMQNLLNCSNEIALKAYDVALNKGAIDEIADGVQGRGPGSMESLIASQIKTTISGQYHNAQMSLKVRPNDHFFNSLFKEYFKKYKLDLNQQQRDAVELSLSSSFGLITGGAGVGKTTVLHAVAEAAKMLNEQLYLIAFTGRAARRMEEASGHPASTIHSFCKKIDDGKINLEHEEPIIIIDESSMIDLPTMFRICLRLQPGCRMIMVGDPGQLPPIGFGVVFHVFCENTRIPQIKLTEIHRQAAETGIPQIAYDIRSGICPKLNSFEGLGSGVSFIDCEFDNITGTIMDVVDSLGGFEEAQILSSLKRGKSGTETINRLAHEFETAGKQHCMGFAPGEPVIWLQNDYDIGLMNGSMGVVNEAVDESLKIHWDPEGNIDIYDITDLDHAYSITVHKAQGSQFGRVIVPVFNSKLLDRALLYTAITRAQYQVVLIGDRNAFNTAVVEQPNTSLRQTAMNYHMEG